MANTRRKTRRHKHRGTQAGTIDRRARPTAPGSKGANGAAAKGRTMTKQERKADARRRRAERLDRPPTWRSALNRAALASVVFAILAATVLDQPPAGAAILGVFMLLIYVPLGYLFDRSIYNMRMRRKRAEADGGGARRGK